MKNGRRSGSRTSNAVRLTTAGSASTWPKSGLIVASRVRPAPSPRRASAPRLPSGRAARPSCPVGASVTSTPAAAYGISSNRRAGAIAAVSVSAPNHDAHAVRSRGTAIQKTSSWVGGT